MHIPSRTAWKHGQGTKLHSRIMRALHALTATRLHSELTTEFDREVMLSSGGQMVGKLWSEVPRCSSDWFDNDHFRASLQIRLGIVKVPAGT
eukprot:11559459-Karenia_brevis.AAC.1